MTTTSPASLSVQSHRVADPRCYGSTSRSPLLTKKARALLTRPTREGLYELEGLLTEHLLNGEDDTLNQALAACPDALSFAMLYGLLARAACQWVGLDNEREPDGFWLFGIPLTLHQQGRQREPAGGTPPAWGAPGNAQDLEELRPILKRTGVARGMRELVVVPHLVDPARLQALPFSELPQLAVGLVTRPAEAFSHPALAPCPWQAYDQGAQSRVLVLAARSRQMPRGLEQHDPRCTEALIAWADQCFGAGPLASVVASSPELLLPTVTGKGHHMANCARLAEFRARTLDCKQLPFWSMQTRTLEDGSGVLEFRCENLSCDWHLHGRTAWSEDLQALDVMLPTLTARFVRAQLGLPDKSYETMQLVRGHTN